jgi:hypothetical protein
MYGIIPKAKMEACEKAPPENMLIKPSKPSEVCDCRFCNWEGSIPGRETNEPNL